MEYIGIVGLLLIFFGWIVQYRTQPNRIGKVFLLLYIVGALLLVVDAVGSRLPLLAILNFGTLVMAILVFKNIRRRRHQR